MTLCVVSLSKKTSIIQIILASVFESNLLRNRLISFINANFLKF